MDAVKFLEELRRVCKSKQRCADCPLSRDTNNDCPLGYPYDWKGENTKKMISIVEKWSAEHPVKTRLMDYLEKYPKAIDENGLPTIKNPILLGYCKYANCIYCPHFNPICDTSLVCWNLPLEE